jgi:large subunit ribosomal protein L18
MLKKYRNLRDRRRAKIKARTHGTAHRPRLSIFRSNRHIYAQLIDDDRGDTLAAVSGLDKELGSDFNKKTKTERAGEVGCLLATKAKKLKISKIVYDRAGYKYHGRVKALIEKVKEGL